MSTRKRTIGRSKSADYFMLPLQQQDVTESSQRPPSSNNARNFLFRSNSLRQKLSLNNSNHSSTPYRRKTPHEDIMIIKNPAFVLFGMASLLFSVWSITTLLRHPYVPSPELNHHHQPQVVYRAVEERRVKERPKRLGQEKPPTTPATTKKMPPPPQNSIPQRNNADETTNDKNPFLCPVAESAEFHLHQPIVLLTQAHSGAETLLHIMAQDPHLLVLSDLFADDRQQIPMLVRLIDQLKQNCRIGDPDVWYTPQQDTFGQDIHALFAQLMTESSGRDLYLELMRKFQNRFLRPWQWLAFIRRIPSVHSHFVFLLQREEWKHFHMPLEAFLLELQEHDSAFVVIYRQHLLQSYAAHQRVLLEEHSSDLPAESKMVVEQEPMERYVGQTKEYFGKIRYFLQTKAPKQSLLLEYHRDLASASELLSTWSKLQSLLQLPATQQHLQLPDFVKDAPLPDQILNWNQLRDDWGYKETWSDDLFGIESVPDAPVDIPVNDTTITESPVTNDMESQRFICPTTEENSHRPIFVFGTPRTGSNLLFNFLAMLGIVWPDADMLNLVELLSPQASDSLKLFALSQIIDHLKDKCQMGDRAMKYFPKYQEFRAPEDMFVSLMTEHSGTELFQKLQDQFQKRHDDPMALIRFLQGIPSPKQSYFALKVFPEHLGDSIEPFIAQIPRDAVVIVLWRRNLLEAYVSLQIALSTNHWMNVEVTAENAIQVDKTAFENYVASTTYFYHQIKTAFAKNNVTYTAFEYQTDLSEESRQQETIRHLQHLLQHRPDSKVTNDVMQGLWTTKQATLPLNEQVVNWNNVVEWGYNRPLDEWENLFPGHLA
jgi:LPS sulfotransferase NodH